MALLTSAGASKAGLSWPRLLCGLRESSYSLAAFSCGLAGWTLFIQWLRASRVCAPRDKKWSEPRDGRGVISIVFYWLKQ